MKKERKPFLMKKKKKRKPTILSGPRNTHNPLANSGPIVSNGVIVGPAGRRAHVRNHLK